MCCARVRVCLTVFCCCLCCFVALLPVGVALCVCVSMLYRLPGHHGSVNDVTFHPYEPVLASASSDKKIFMGEL